MKRFRTLFTVALGVAALGTAMGASHHSWANAPRPEKEELDLAALDAAPWLVCGSLSPAPDTPRLMTWNYREMKFETKTDKNPLEANDTGSFVLIFDDHKSRAVFLGVEKDGSLERLEHKDQVGDVVSRSLPTEVTFKILGSLLLVSVSHFPAADQRFIGLLQITVAPFFSDKDPVAEMIPIACTITADDALKIQIEATRQKWLAGELAVPAPVEAPPLPPIAAPPAPPPVSDAPIPAEPSR